MKRRGGDLDTKETMALVPASPPSRKDSPGKTKKKKSAHHCHFTPLYARTAASQGCVGGGSPQRAAQSRANQKVQWLLCSESLVYDAIVHHDARAGKSSPSSTSRRQSTGDVSDEKAKKRKKKPRPSMPEVGGDGGLE